MDIKQVLEELTAYYLTSRQVGHTTLMKRGTSNYEQKKLVMVHNMSYGRDLGLLKNEVVSLHSLDRLRGSDLPLAIDNGTLTTIFTMSLDRFTQFEEEIKRVIMERERMRALAYEHENTINKMRAQPFKTLFKTLWRRW